MKALAKRPSEMNKEGKWQWS